MIIYKYNIIFYFGFGIGALNERKNLKSKVKKSLKSPL